MCVLRYTLTIHMVRSREGEDLAGADIAGANVAGARSQQARAVSVRATGGISGSGFLRVWGSLVRPTYYSDSYYLTVFGM